LVESIDKVIAMKERCSFLPTLSYPENKIDRQSQGKQRAIEISGNHGLKKRIVCLCAREVYSVISSIVTECKETLHKPPFMNRCATTALNIRRVYLIPFQAVPVNNGIPGDGA